MTRTSDAAFLARQGIRSVRVVYGGAEGRASFKHGDEWVKDPYGNPILESETTLLFDAVLASELGLAELSDISVYPVDQDTGTPTTYRIRQIRNEQDGLYRRAVLAA